MELEMVIADPAGNITVFVLNQIEDPLLRAQTAKALLAEPSLKAEQVGFVSPPGYPAGRKSPRWRWEMMGGEFCGNAARSFGRYVAREEAVASPAGGATGGWAPQSTPRIATIEISGAKAPLETLVAWQPELPAKFPPGADTSTPGAAVTGTAEVGIPPPIGCDTLALGDRVFPVYFFEGITHVIAEGLSPDRDLVFALLEQIGAGRPAAWPSAAQPLAALGVMFYNPEQRFLRPAVYVAATGSLVFESSCGSGTAALATWMAKDKFDSDDRWAIAQPGGLIEGRVKKQTGKITAISIGGPVTLDRQRSITI
jgi:diaminopimelate epimerase